MLDSRVELSDWSNRFLRYFYFVSYQNSVSPLPCFELACTVEVGSSALTHVLLITAFKPISSFSPYVYAFSMHLSSFKLSIIVRSIRISHSPPSLDSIKTTFKFYLSFIRCLVAKIYVYCQSIFEKVLLSFANIIDKSDRSIFTLSAEFHLLIEFRITSNPRAFQSKVLISEVKLSQSLSFVFFDHSFVEMLIWPDYFPLTLSESLMNLPFVVELLWRKYNTYSCLLLSFFPVSLSKVFFLRFQFCVLLIVLMFDGCEVMFVAWRSYGKTVISKLFSDDLVLTASDSAHTQLLYLSSLIQNYQHM